MTTLTIRDVPEDLHRTLTALAARNRRSLQAQVLILLEAARRLDGPSALDEARAIRERLAGQPLGDVVQDVRDERAR